MIQARIIAVAGTALLIAGCNTSETPEKTIQQLMAQDVQPTAEVYWDAVQYISDESGSREIVPQTDEDWKKVQDAAVRMGAHAELLKTPGYTDGRGEDWVQFANSLGEVSKRAEQAAAEKNPDKVFEVGGIMYSVCSACHQVYPPAAGVPGEEAPGAS